jgi:hypothetical protein
MEQCPFEKLVVTQLVKKFPDFYGTQKFIIVFTAARHWFLSWTRLIQSTTFILFLYDPF